jgi:hypothetical protein
MDQGHEIQVRQIGDPERDQVQREVIAQVEAMRQSAFCLFSRFPGFLAEQLPDR